MQEQATGKRSVMERVMNVIEKLGNKLPHPFWLFAVLALLTVVFSFVLSAINWSASYETVVDGVPSVMNAKASGK